MDELKKLIEAAKGMLEGIGDDVHTDRLDALRAAIPAAEAELAGVMDKHEAARNLLMTVRYLWFNKDITLNTQDAADHLDSIRRYIDAPPSEPEENQGEYVCQPIGNCPTCGIPIYTDEGFCGVCGRR